MVEFGLNDLETLAHQIKGINNIYPTDKVINCLKSNKKNIQDFIDSKDEVLFFSFENDCEIMEISNMNDANFDYILIKRNITDDRLFDISKNNKTAVQNILKLLESVANATSLDAYELRKVNEFVLNYNQSIKSGNELVIFPSINNVLNGLQDNIYNNIDLLYKTYVDLVNEITLFFNFVDKSKKSFANLDTLIECKFWQDYSVKLNQIEIFCNDSDKMTETLIKNGKIKQNTTGLSKIFNLSQRLRSLEPILTFMNDVEKFLNDLSNQNEYTFDSLNISHNKGVSFIKRLKALSDYPYDSMIDFSETISNKITTQYLNHIIPKNLIIINENEFNDLNKNFQNWHKVIIEGQEEVRKTLRDIKANRPSERDNKTRKLNFKANILIDRWITITDIYNSLKIFNTLINQQPEKEFKSSYDVGIKTLSECNINILDFSEIGNTSWHNYILRSKQIIDKLESKLANDLKIKLDMTNDAFEMFRIFENYKLLIQRPKIRMVIQSFKELLLKFVGNSLDNLQNELDNGFNKTH